MPQGAFRRGAGGPDASVAACMCVGCGPSGYTGGAATRDHYQFIACSIRKTLCSHMER